MMGGGSQNDSLLVSVPLLRVTETEMASVGIEGFYRQKKKGGVAKPPRKGITAGRSKAVVAAVSANDQEEFSVLGSDDGKVSIVSAFVKVDEEEKLRQFDLDMRYGPCVGLSRVERWGRAAVMGLNPPAEVEAILLKLSDVATDCLWFGRV